jgi:hypothetical protein
MLRQSQLEHGAMALYRREKGFEWRKTPPEGVHKARAMRENAAHDVYRHGRPRRLRINPSDRHSRESGNPEL